MDLGIHAYGMYTWAWAYDCTCAWVYEIGFIRISIHMHMCNVPEWHGSKLVSIHPSLRTHLIVVVYLVLHHHCPSTMKQHLGLDPPLVECHSAMPFVLIV